MTRIITIFMKVCQLMLALALPVTLLLPPSSQAQDGSPAPSFTSAAASTWKSPGSARKAYQIDQLVRQMYNENQFNGSVLVMEKGEVIFHKAFGWANILKRDTLKTTTPFRLASVSKQFTAMAIMILVEQGKISLEEDMRKYIPELPYKGITIRNLLHHNSGIRDYFSLATQIRSRFPSARMIHNEDLIQYFAEKKPGLLFKTGKKASYSNTGYAFLASIVERATGISFPRFLHENIFQPLKMEHAYVYTTQNFVPVATQDTLLERIDTVFQSFNELQIETHYKVVTRIRNVEKKRAYGYILSQPQLYAPFDYHPLDGIYGEKSICASTEDFIKWEQALSNYTLVTPATMLAAYRASPITDQSRYGYGYGWKIHSKIPGLVYHHGLYRGFRTCILRDLLEERTIVILSNRKLGNKVTQLSHVLRKILLGKSYKVPKAWKLEKNTQARFQEKLKISY